MIRLHRPDCPYPKPLDEKKSYKHPRNKAALVEAAAGKCMYCESRIIDTQYGDIEHLKPKDKFPELEFEWSNLGFACTVCNNSKNKHYSKRTRIVDPYQEEPAQFLHADGAQIFGIDWESIGRNTVDLIKLNRTALVEKRVQRTQDVANLIETARSRHVDELRDGAIEIVLEETSPTTEFSFVSRALAERLLKYLDVSLSTDTTEQTPTEGSMVTQERARAPRHRDRVRPPPSS